MVLIKKLDLFILKKFLLVFFGAFFVTLFVFMMQFTWQQLDKLVGKGLTADVLAEFFWYMAITIVPMSLPMSVLLASLISFGNMGEKLELLSMKAAGISLVRIMRPVGVLAVGLMVLLFHFQNKTLPDAQLKLRTLIFSLKQTSPALEIPEGVFYNGVPSFNLYVEKKNVATGMLYNLMVYKTDEGFDKAQIVVSDSGRMEMTDDKMHLVLDIWGGEQFENLNGGQAGQMGVKNNPSDRETFRYKRFIIDFDSNFDRMDEEQLRGMPSAKNLVQLDESIDSVNAELDSIGRAYYKELIPRAKPLAQVKKNKMKLAPSASVQENYSGDASAPSVEASAASARVPIANAKPTEAENANDKLASALRMARNDVSRAKAELEWRSSLTEDEERYVRRHRMEWHQKFTLSLACLFFFLIGAPLGAIVRKGGLGMPAVISVVIFIIYYLMNTLGSKMAKDGTWDVVFGMWMSTAVLAPTGIWLTYKSNRDSVVFNIDAYIDVVKRFFGIRSARHVTRKEVIIDDPDYTRLATDIDVLRADLQGYAKLHRLQRPPNYLRLFFRNEPGDAVAITERVEAVVEELSNTDDLRILNQLRRIPVMYTHSHAAPFDRPWLNKACGALLPIGLVFWMRSWRFRLRLLRDLRQTSRTFEKIQEYVAEKVVPKEINDFKEYSDPIAPNNPNNQS